MKTKVNLVIARRLVFIAILIISCNLGYSQNNIPSVSQLTKDYLEKQLKSSCYFPKVFFVKVPYNIGLLDLGTGHVNKLYVAGQIVQKSGRYGMHYAEILNKELILNPERVKQVGSYDLATAAEQLTEITKVEIINEYKVKVTFNVTLSRISQIGQILGYSEGQIIPYTIEMKLDIVNGWFAECLNSYPLAQYESHLSSGFVYTEETGGDTDMRQPKQMDAQTKASYLRALQKHQNSQDDKSVYSDIINDMIANTIHYRANDFSGGHTIKIAPPRLKCTGCDSYTINEFKKSLKRGFSKLEQLTEVNVEDFKALDDSKKNILSFSINKISVSSDVNSNGNKDYGVSVLIAYEYFTMKPKEEIFKGVAQFNGGRFLVEDTKQQAVEQATAKFEKWLQKFACNASPEVATFESFKRKGKKNKIKGIVLTPEQNYVEAYKHAYLVYEFNESGNYRGADKIGQVDYNKHEGENILCYFTTGKKDIIKAKEEGKKLIFITAARL